MAGLRQNQCVQCLQPEHRGPCAGPVETPVFAKAPSHTADLSERIQKRMDYYTEEMMWAGAIGKYKVARKHFKDCEAALRVIAALQ